jgi:hypothetical protein
MLLEVLKTSGESSPLQSHLANGPTAGGFVFNRTQWDSFNGYWIDWDSLEVKLVLIEQPPTAAK